MFAVFGLSSLHVVSIETKKNEVNRVPAGKKWRLYINNPIQKLDIKLHGSKRKQKTTAHRCQ